MLNWIGMGGDKRAPYAFVSPHANPPSVNMNFGLISIYANSFLIATVMILAWEILQSAMFVKAFHGIHFRMDNLIVLKYP